MFSNDKVTRKIWKKSLLLSAFVTVCAIIVSCKFASSILVLAQTGMLMLGHGDVQMNVISYQKTILKYICDFSQHY